jgi:hypothetical protein
METAKTRDALGWEIIRQACTWAGLLLGLAIVLKDLIEPVEFTYVTMTVLVAWTVAMTPAWRQQESPGKWAGLISAGLVILTAIAMRLVMGW